MFSPLNSRKFKRSRASERSDQAIKDDFHRSRFLIMVANASMGDAYVTTPCRDLGSHVPGKMGTSLDEHFAALYKGKCSYQYGRVQQPSEGIREIRNHNLSRVLYNYSMSISIVVITVVKSIVQSFFSNSIVLW